MNGSSEIHDSFGAKIAIQAGGRPYTIYRVDCVQGKGALAPSRLPISLRILVENLLRHEDGRNVRPEDIEALASWDPRRPSEKEIAFRPARVLLQDFTGVPCVVDLAAMRDAVKERGGDPKTINPLQPVDLVIDHSVQADVTGSPEAFGENTRLEFERNQERYQFLRWGQQAFRNFRLVPPGTGIVHQVNLEYLAPVVFSSPPEASGRVGGRTGQERQTLAYPDTLVGADSHTTMINALGVLGWGVGGIEAEAAMLGQPISMLIPQVVGVRLSGELRQGVTATDLVLIVTEMLRKKGVVGKFVEFFGPGLSILSLPDRATVANMCPEYGATVGFFPVDGQTLEYLRLTGRSPDLMALVEAYHKEQGWFRTPESSDPVFSDVLELDLTTVEASLAGPRRPQDRVSLGEAKRSFREALPAMTKVAAGASARPESATAVLGEDAVETAVDHGSVVIAAITSCTNTSNPSVMMGAGILAKKAVARGLQVKPWVKTSLAPGSQVVIDYLRETKLLEALEKLRFHLVGFGCTTCIGNSGPLPEPVARAVRERDLVVAAVLSGNRNFEGRINPLVRANYLASPPLVVAYALAGTMDVDLTTEPLGKDRSGKPVYLRDIWPAPDEIREALKAVTAGMFRHRYSHVFEGDEAWRAIRIPAGHNFRWDPQSTYVKSPPYFEALPEKPRAPQDLAGARVLVLVGDSVTTDHISPAGSIAKESPAGQYLISRGVAPKDFNSYGARRGNHEVMVRGTFANVRLRNLLAPGTEGGWTRHLADGERMSIYDAAMKYREEGVPLLVIAGKEYGSGSSRDWAAKGPALLGVKVVLAESFERIHRTNLVGMGILPLEFERGSSRESLGLTGEEIFSVRGMKDLSCRKKLEVKAQGERGEKTFHAIARIDTPVELSYYLHGGILPYVMRDHCKK